MDDFGRRIKHITRELKEYMETRLELTMLDFGDKISRIIGTSIQQVVGYLILGVGLVFGLTALAIFLGEILEERWAGYAIVATPFIFLGFYMIVARPRFITRHIQEEILNEMLDSFKQENKDTVEQEEVDEISPKSLPAHPKSKKES